MAKRGQKRAAPKTAQPKSGRGGNRRGRLAGGGKRALTKGGAKKGGSFFWAFVGRSLVAVFVLSVLWVGAYRFVPPPTTLYMAGQAVQGYQIRQDWVAISQVSPYMVRSVIGAEDQKFCSHWGFDLGAVREAVAEAQNGEGVRGASTISQQTAKNAFLWHGRGVTAAVRKALEVYFTALMETLWPKSRIMEVYLNVAEFGPGVFGVEAASKTYFGKSASRLSPREAALLAAVLPSPKKWSAAKPGPFVAQRARILERRGWIVKREGLAHCVPSAER